MGLGKKIKKAVKKAAKAVVKTVTTVSNKAASLASDAVSDTVKAVGLNGLSRDIDKVGDAATNVITKSTETVAKSILNPIRSVHNLATNPAKWLSNMTGLSALFPTPAALPGSANQQQAIISSAGNQEETKNQARARMITRQGAQNNNPIMLLGQGVDFDALDLAKDEELGGESR